MAKKKNKSKNSTKPPTPPPVEPTVEPVADTSPASQRPAWMVMGSMGLLIALMLVGVVISVYMSWHHEVEVYGGESLDVPPATRSIAAW